MNSGYVISKIVIIESLDETFLTGKALYEYLKGITSTASNAIPVEIINCDSADNFREIIIRLTEDARLNGNIPLIHIECHGLDDCSGLSFKDNSDLKWPNMAELLRQLNIATRFNLFVVFSACFGAHFLGEMQATMQAPCWGMLGPTEIVWPDELLGGFRDFYRNLILKLDACVSLNAILQRRLDSGRFYKKQPKAGLQPRFWAM